MWAHYASQFKGICIEYDLIQLLRSLPKEVDFVRMFYNEDRPQVGLTNRRRNELAKMILSYKNHRWLYEREWRMFAEQGRVYYRNRRCVGRVYIGSRIELKLRRMIESRLEPLNIPITRMYLDGYSMIFHPR
jgi:hypothetical protein